MSTPDSGASRRIARNTFARASGEAVAKAASLVLYVTMARELGSEGFGTFMFALALTGALIIGAGFGTDELTAREVARDRSRASRYLSNVTAIKVLTSVVLLGVAVALVLLGDYSTESRLAVCIVGVGVALEVMSRTSYALFEAHERLGLVSRSVIIQRVLTAIVGIAVLRSGGGVVAVSFVFAAGALAGLVTAEVSVRRLGVRRTTPEPSSWPALVRAGLPIGLAGLLFVLLLRLDVTLLSFLAGEAEVGLYAAAYRLVEGTQFIAWAASAAMLPWLARAEGTDAWFGLSRGTRARPQGAGRSAAAGHRRMHRLRRAARRLALRGGVSRQRRSASTARPDVHPLWRPGAAQHGVHRPRLTVGVRASRRGGGRAQRRRQPRADSALWRRRIRRRRPRVEPGADDPRSSHSPGDELVASVCRGLSAGHSRPHS